VKLTAPTIPKEKKSAPPKVEANKSAPPKVETKVTPDAPPAKKPAASKPAFGGLKMPKLPQMPSLGTPMKESPEDKEKKCGDRSTEKGSCRTTTSGSRGGVCRKEKDDRGSKREAGKGNRSTSR
jgi:hypothetical protein